MKLPNIKLEDLYWRIKTGPSIRKGTIYDIRPSINEKIKSPVFFLSTGRCGTKWFSELLKLNNSLFVNHAPIPSLAMQSKVIYTHLHKTNNPDIKALLTEIFFTAREQHLRYSYKTGRRYIETNNYISFLAPLLAEIFHDAQFIHLIRHPAAFIRSGMRRGYYTDSTQDIKRIVPLPDSEYYESWESFSRLEKIAWLWKETNNQIEHFKSSNNNHFTFVFDELNTEQIEELLEFLKISIPVKKIEARLSKKKNKQSAGHFPRYEKWKQSDQEKMISLCRNEMETYKMNY